MIVIPSTNSVWWDIDDTLILWSPTQEQLDKDGIDIVCPAGFVLVDDEPKSVESFVARVVPHKTHIEQLKKHKMRGHLTVLWSSGGWDWAQAVAKALGLEQYVDLVISKPTWAYDDMPADRILKSIQWMKDE